ncbi:hypothetical protein IW150_005521 [Coemansia sp. RSA 2607]|nr:hypothetical protein IW150_005521 [Coemansia sp. RSA 2607]
MTVTNMIRSVMTCETTHGTPILTVILEQPDILRMVRLFSRHRTQLRQTAAAPTVFAISATSHLFMRPGMLLLLLLVSLTTARRRSLSTRKYSSVDQRRRTKMTHMPQVALMHTKTVLTSKPVGLRALALHRCLLTTRSQLHSPGYRAMMMCQPVDTTLRITPTTIPMTDPSSVMKEMGTTMTIMIRIQMLEGTVNTRAMLLTTMVMQNRTASCLSHSLLAVAERGMSIQSPEVMKMATITLAL